MHTEPDGSAYAPGGRPLTGWKVLAMIAAFFALVVGVNGVMIYAAVKTFRGEVVAHPYERGLAYNRDIAQAREQAARDWRVDVSLRRAPGGVAAVTVVARDADGAGVTGVAMNATLAAPADLSQDVRLRLEETASGRFEGRATVSPGWRDLVLTAERDGREVFRSKNRVHVE